MLQTSSKKQSVNWNELKQSSLDTGSHMDRIRAYHRGWDESGRGRLGAGGGHTNDALYSTQNFCTFKSKDYLSVLEEWKSWLSHVVLVQCTFDSISSNKDKETTELNMHPVLNGKNNVFYLKKMWKYRKVQWRKKKEKRGGGGGGKKVWIITMHGLSCKELSKEGASLFLQSNPRPGCWFYAWQALQQEREPMHEPWVKKARKIHSENQPANEHSMRISSWFNTGGGEIHEVQGLTF